MNKIRTSSHIRTYRSLKSFRACINATGISQILPELGRIHFQECHRLNRVLHATQSDNARRPHLGA